ncbi:MAG: twin-arginine translocase subunit TatC [Bacteroidales bacterium]|nr:twin-arginine translocase subunit TatC [Candidatus Liminaster caballi]
MADLERMPMAEHLDVLRRMLMRLAVVAAVLMMAVFCMRDAVFQLLLAPKEYNFITFRAIEHLLHLLGSDFCFEPYHISLINTELAGQFMAHLSTSLYLAILIASPYILIEILGFILPALYQNEKRVAVRLCVVMYMLFAVGVLMNYFVLFPISFRFLGTYQVDATIANTITLQSYFSSFSTLTFMMGLVFQMPVAVRLLSHIGLVSASMMRRYRRHAIVGIMVIAALITPPDLFTLFLVTLPLYMLYEVSIWVIK